MTENLSERLAEQLDHGAPPLGITADAMAAKGRKRVRARRFALGGGLTAGVAVIAAAALVLPAAFGGGGGSAPADVPADVPVNAAEAPAEEQPSHPLPPIDPDKFYDWTSTGDGASTAETEQLTDALWEYLAGKGLDLKQLVEPGDKFVTVTRENFPEFLRRINELMEDTPDGNGESSPVPNGHTQPAYEYGNLIVQYSKDKQYTDTLSVKVSPKDGYLPGPGQPERGVDTQYVPHLFAGCEDIEYGGQSVDAWKTDFTCSDATTSTGEQAAISEALVINPYGTGAYRSLTVVVYRADGSAVTLTDTMQLQDTHVAVADDYLEKKKFALDTDALIALAEALPNVIVK